MKPESKKGFTLIELLIVTVVIVTLMGIVFRLAGTGSEAKSRSVTIQRLQRIEFALSGYYAAYGSYPPVPLHGYRSIYYEVNDRGIQTTREKKASFTQISDQIEAACRSQPIAVRYPLNQDADSGPAMAKALSQLYQRQGKNLGTFDAMESSLGRFSRNGQSEKWTDIQLFQFGLLSFLLPRYYFMLEGNVDLFDDARYNAQWTANNRLPCRLTNGIRYGSWDELRKDMGIDKNGRHQTASNQGDKYAVQNIMSQAVCARWMTTFEHIIAGGREFFGVDTADPDHKTSGTKIFAPGDADSNSKSQQYMLDGMTVLDGWGHEFYYYSAPPYQSYRLWSAGADGKTFPPWIELKAVDDGKDRETAAKWLSDDIVGLSN